MQQRILFLLLSSLYFLTISSCKKDDLLTDGDAKLKFSSDSVKFDTVFVSIGSATKNLRVYNTYDRPIKISNIRLASGNASYYRINVNGTPGRSFNDVEIRANDSLWIFVEVTVDPNSSVLPYILQDSIVFETNGNTQDVDLVSWGQNAHFIVADQVINLKDANGVTTGQIKYALIDTNLNGVTTWDNQLPYVVYGGYAVIDSSTTLNILEGTRIHFSNNAGLWVYKGGNLHVTGTKDNPVIFQGLRLEEKYKEEPGQWDRIWINDGGQNTIDYAIIKNGFIGIQTETIIGNKMPNSTLQLTNTRIRNMSGLGILARNWDITGNNLLVTNCGQYNAALTIGGSYEFTQCTFANYWNGGQRSNPVLYINNYASNTAVDLAKADFKNCIIFGDNDNELELDFKNSSLKEHRFMNCILKVDNNTPVTDPLHFFNIYKNNAPGFVDGTNADFRLNAGAFAVNKGDASFVTGIPFDIEGNARILGVAPDLGAFEKE